MRRAFWDRIPGLTEHAQVIQIIPYKGFLFRP